MSAWSLGEWVVLKPAWLVVAFVILAASLFLRSEGVQSHWQRVLSPALMRFLSADAQQRSRCNLALLIAAIAAASLSQPVVRQSDDDTWRHSIGWIAVADVSRSMTLNDTVPSRLGAMREALAELSRQAGARPLAMILFSGDAFLVAPPAFDRSVFNEHAALLEHGVIPTEGSNLARALSLATAVINDSQFIAARVFVLGDTGGISKSSVAAAQYLGEAGHRVDTLVFGSSRENSDIARTSTQTDTAIAGWNDAGAGNDETQVNWQQADLLSRAGHGISTQANPFGVINYDDLDLSAQASPSTHSALKSLVWRNQSHWLLLLAIPLLLLLFRHEARYR